MEMDKEKIGRKEVGCVCGGGGWRGSSGRGLDRALACVTDFKIKQKNYIISFLDLNSPGHG